MYFPHSRKDVNIYYFYSTAAPDLLFRQTDRKNTVRLSNSGLCMGLCFRASGDQLGDADYEYCVLTETESMNELAGSGVSNLPKQVSFFDWPYYETNTLQG